MIEGSAARAPLVVTTVPMPQPVVRLVEQAGLHLLRVAPEELASSVAGATAILPTITDRVTAELMDAAGPELRLVANIGAGVDNVDVESATARGVLVTNTPDVLTDATADLTMGLLLSVTRRMGEAERFLRDGKAWSWGFDFMLGRSVQGMTLGIIGLGRIGSAVAARATAFGMSVVTASARPSSAPTTTDDAEYPRVPLEQLLERADAVTLHCPLTKDTHHLIDGSRLSRMKHGAYLINTARGPIVEEHALLSALREGRLGGAGLDVFEFEPSIVDGLLQLENVVALPHIGSATREVREAMAELAARNVVAVLAGQAALTPVVPVSPTAN